jgi:NAD(P)-dependent dehydrogenase (short-subunit alcohol dehydrogenase family)
VTGLKDLQGKMAVVTGGASGIGRGIATALKAEGMTVVIADVEQRALEATAAELGVEGIRTDVSDFDSVARLAEEVCNRHGTVHVVCNNAGIGGSAPISALTMSDWRWTVNVNLWGVIHGVQVFLPILRANAEGGHIVNTSSMAGLRATPGIGAYTVTKFAVVGLSEVLAEELAAEWPSVGVSVLCPALVRTNIGKVTRNRPEQFADGRLGDPAMAASARALRSRGEGRFVMEPEEAGVLVANAIKSGDLYILTDASAYDRVEERHQRIEAAFKSAAEREAALPPR